jgi:hypothetical protein
MTDQRFWSVNGVTGYVLVAGFAANLAGVLMFFYRGGLQGSPPPSPTYFVWERSFIMASVVLTAIGLVLLEGYLQNTNGYILARAGATAYLFGAVFIVAAEALSLNQGSQNLYPLIVIHVVLALLAQAVVGAALLQSGLLPAWIGWVTIVWNIAFLVVLPVTSPRDMYYPILHHVMPLVIGIALLRK